MFVLTHRARETVTKAGLLDEMQLHVVPVLLGAGERLFDDPLTGAPRRLERTRMLESPTGVTHLRCRVTR